MNRKLSNKNCAFVASTLPLYTLDKNIEKWKISEIIVASKELFDSYNCLTENHQNIKLKLAPKGRFKQAIYISRKLLKVKLHSREIFIFHECCWVLLDLLIRLIKPKGRFYPQVTMSGFPIIKSRNISGVNLFSCLKIIGFYRLFTVHKLISDRTNSESFVYSLDAYPKTIYKYKISSRLRHYQDKNSKSKKVLFIIGSDNCQDGDLILLLEGIVKMLFSKGYECIFKDHPRKNARLNIGGKFSLYSVKFIEPKNSVELLDDDYVCAIGVASTALVFFGNRAISLIDLMKCMPIEIRRSKKQHLLTIPDGKYINFIKHKDEILDILN
jgi:hypothetical protein